MVQSGAEFRRETHPLTFMLQTYDADNTAESRTALTTALKLFSRFHFGGL